MKKFTSIAGWLALASGFVALFFYIVLPDLKTLILSLIALSISNGIFLLVSEGTSLKKFFSSRMAQHGTNAIILTSVFLGVLIFTNLLIHRHKHRFDFTEANLFTLAPQTKKFIANLPREVNLTAFFQIETPEKNAFENLIAGYLEETDKIGITYIDPDKNPAVTKQYGVTTYGTIVLESGSKETKVQNATEENLTNALLKVTRDEQKVIYFLEGHGENRIDSTENEGHQTAKKNLEQDGFISFGTSALTPDRLLATMNHRFVLDPQTGTLTGSPLTTPLKGASQRTENAKRRFPSSRSGSKGVPWGVPVDPEIPKMAPRGAKIEPPGLPKDRFGRQK